MTIATDFAVLSAEGISASTPYVLVDLSQYGGASFLYLDRLVVHFEKASDGVYDVWVGIVTENDATDGSASWIHVFHLEAVGNPTDSTDRFVQTLEFDGLSLDVVGGALIGAVTNATQADSTNWQNDTARVSPWGNVNPGVGDLVVWVEEVSGAGTLDMLLSAKYQAI